MSMYNMIFAHNPAAPQLLALVRHADPTIEFARLRDAWVEKDDDDQILIRVHTRLGGGNRPAYYRQIASIQSHPWYVRDEDMPFDPTYADFYFRPDLDALTAIDPALPRMLIAGAIDPVDMTERWGAAFKALDDGV
jgi:hypothetical protein